MNRHLLVLGIRFLLIFLWIYAALSKLLDYSKFLLQLKLQSIPEWSVGVLSWLLPCIEFIVLILLLLRKGIRWGLYLSSILLLIFTGYIGLVLAGVLSKHACACGGILTHIGFRGHLLFNLVFLGLSVAGIILYRKDKLKD